MHYECPSKHAPEKVPNGAPDPPQTGSQKDPASRPQTTPKRRPRRHKKDRKEKPARGASRGVSKPAPGSPVAMQWQSSGNPVANPGANILWLLFPRWGGFDNWDLVIEMEVSLFDMPPAGITCTRRFATGFATGLPLVCHWIATGLPLDCHWTGAILALGGLPPYDPSPAARTTPPSEVHGAAPRRPPRRQKPCRRV